jgi:DNA-binding FadR family transcriptional regulator
MISLLSYHSVEFPSVTRELYQMPPESNTEPTDERIVRRKLSDLVFDKLRNMIVEGELSAGDPMPSERALMERFAVGRPAVREALQSMHTMGLITISHGERSRVNALNAGMAFRQIDDMAQLLLSAKPENLDNLKETRRLVEVGIIRIGTARSTSEDVAELRELVEAQRKELGNAEAFMKADIAFHNRIAETTGNPLIVAVSEAMLRWLFKYHTSLLHWSGREETTLSEHQKIVDLIEARDIEGSAELMEEHLNRSDILYKHHRQ